MAKRVSVTLFNAGFRKLRTSPPVVADLKRRLTNIGTTAGPGHRVRVSSGGSRARGTVYAVSMAAKRREARDRTLTKALDAGRR